MSTSLERPAARRAAALSPRFMLRLAGLPVAAAQRLRSADARGWADGILDEEHRLGEAGARLSDPLAALVADNEDDTMRRAVLRLRRAVFNNRLPQDVPGALALAARIDGPIGAELLHWLRDRQTWEERRAQGQAVLATAFGQGREALRELAAGEQLRTGLLLASPTLDGQLDAYIRGDAAASGKRGRKIERSLLAYLYRTACKTSPFSTFTGVAVGEFRADGADGANGTSGGGVRVAERWTGHARLNVVVLRRLADAIAADPERRGDLLVSLASGWELDDDRVRFVRRSVTAGDDSAAVSFDAARDRLFFLRRSGALEDLLGLLRERPRLRHRDLVAWLGSERGATADEAERYLSALLQLGMVQLNSLHPDVHSHDPLRAFQDALREVGRPWATGLAERLEATAADVAAYAGAPPDRRRELLTGLRRELPAVVESLGASGTTLPQTLLYEDARASAETVTADAERWTELAEGPLRSLARVLPAFDVSLAQRLTFKGFFLARYGSGGRCDDLLRLVHDFHEDLFEQYLLFTSRRGPHDAADGHPAEENWLGLPQITALDRARAAFVEGMRQRWRTRDADAAELRIDEDLVDAVAAELAPLPRGFAPQSHFVQLADRPGDPLVVLNGSYGGLCFPFTRFTHCFDTPDDTPGLSERLLAALRAAQPEGAVFAEITAGSATTNLNLHGRMTDYQILCPGETGSAPPEARIHLDDLFVEHDPDEDRLVVRSRRLGKEVIPLYLGYLVPMVLPEIPRTLLLLSPTSKTALDVWTGVPEAPALDGVTRRPRVRHGSLVLSRRRWTADASALPLRPAGEDDADWFLRWQRWRRVHGVPARAFATVLPGEGGSGGWAGGSKPHYVDFDSPLSLLALEGLVKDPTGRVVLEEMLPAEDDLHVTSDRGRHVAELAVEIIPTGPAHPVTDEEGHGERA
ncbi:lantibiotic dehydratase [Streptomyces sp. NPDC026673]|uniref:lantibiotic dehydratase n=1 Tax=Streptomyces sp. NPDC026673 TaxID=3155724 RepID=UPI0033E8C1D2